MVKKIANIRKNKDPAKKKYLRKKPIKNDMNHYKKVYSKKSKLFSKTFSSERKLNKQQKNVSNSDLISQSFFDTESFIKLQCCFCSKNINNSIKVILEPFPKQSSKNFNFIKKSILPFEVACLKCFINKSKLNNFKKIESQNYFYDTSPHEYNCYHIISKMNEPIFTDDWTLEEEIKLLGALAHLGIGNWEDISKILGKGKFECRSHYHAFYYKKQNDYLPNLNNLNNKNKINERKKNKSIENQILSKICKEIGYIPYNIDNNQSNRSVNMSRSNSKSEHNSNKIQLQNACNTLGYWPKRHEFDVEYKNDAEIELMEIDYQEKEKNKTQENMIEIYDKMLFDYNLILEKRDERKNFILENNLYDVKKQSMNEKKLEKEDREIYQSVKQSLKYLTNEQFKEYYEGIILEKNLKSRLNQLLYYYKIGYKTYGQIYKYIYNLKQKSNKIRDRYNIKTNLKNLNVSLRESTVKQVDKLNIK